MTPRFPDDPVRIAPAGDEAVLVVFGQVIRRDVNARVRSLAALLMNLATGRPPEARWLVELVPAYGSLLVRYDPDRIRYDTLQPMLAALAEQAAAAAEPTPRRFNIPVRYGGENGPDLKFVADYTGLTPTEVVALHSQPVYVVYMLGFTPGFCYLGDMPPALAVPRRETPRLALPAGAVAIGGAQTGVYSLDNSPGGWRWIGRTDMTLWDPRRDPPFTLRAGDEVRFVPV